MEADKEWGTEMTRRNKLEILGCILNICKADGSSKTKIVYQVNLNFKNAGLYIEWLTLHGYLVKEERLYKTTPSGHELLHTLNNINATINDNLECVLAGNDKLNSL
ncbi:MAG: winged helix-turn-helix domain-containing protein [Methanothrix sp.]|nr:winged helix-turn-helix domain-containing protein [Methanothrix sp.]